VLREGAVKRLASAVTDILVLVVVAASFAAEVPAGKVYRIGIGI